MKLLGPEPPQMDASPGRISLRMGNKIVAFIYYVLIRIIITITIIIIISCINRKLKYVLMATSSPSTTLRLEVVGAFSAHELLFRVSRKLPVTALRTGKRTARKFHERPIFVRHALIEGTSHSQPYS